VPMLDGRREQYEMEGIVSLLTVPLTIRDESAGSVVFYYRTPHRTSDIELKVATALGQLAAAAVRNAMLNEEQQRLRREAQNANRLKDEFLATLSHELRTPLNVIAGRARRLRDGGLSPAAVQQIGQIVERNAHALTRLVEDLLDVSRFTLGQVTLQVQLLDWRHIVQAVLNGLEPTARSKGVELVVDLSPDVPSFMGDPTRLQQVTWNLLMNAIKFTPSGGRINVALTRRGGEVVLTVTDTGVGISPEFLPSVFDVFRQEEPATNRQHGGLGLGLSIVKRLVELHGGHVHASSPGRGLGSTFEVRLPCSVEAMA